MKTPDAIRHIPAQAELLFSSEQIEVGIKHLAEKLTHEFSKKNPVFLVMMNGAMMFSTQLLKQFNFPLQVDYLHLSRYSDGLNAGSLEWKAYPQFELKGRYVVLLDDILDEGKSLDAAHNFCEQQGASVVRSVVLLKKNLKERQASYQTNDFVFECPDRYVFGYGMDYLHYWRNLNAIYALPDTQTA